MAVLGTDGENEGEEIEEGVEGDGSRTRGPEATHQYRALAAAAPRRRWKALSSLREWWWSRRKCSGPTRAATNISSRPGQITRYPLPVPELPGSEPELPEPEVPDPKFG